MAHLATETGFSSASLQVLATMRACGVSPDVASYSTLVNAWSTAGMPSEAEAVVEEMTAAGVAPDVEILTTLAKGHQRRGDGVAAEGVLASMAGRGLRPNVVTYTTVISAYCSTGRGMEDAMRVFRAMKEGGVEPSGVTYRTLVWGFSEAEEPRKAEQILELMETSGMLPDSGTYEQVATAWQALGLWAEAAKVAEKGERAPKGEGGHGTDGAAWRPRNRRAYPVGVGTRRERRGGKKGPNGSEGGPGGGTGGVGREGGGSVEPKMGAGGKWRWKRQTAAEMVDAEKVPTASATCAPNEVESDVKRVALRRDSLLEVGTGGERGALRKSQSQSGTRCECTKSRLGLEAFRARTRLAIAGVTSMDGTAKVRYRWGCNPFIQGCLNERDCNNVDDISKLCRRLESRRVLGRGLLQSRHSMVLVSVSPLRERCEFGVRTLGCDVGNVGFNILRVVVMM